MIGSIYISRLYHGLVTISHLYHKLYVHTIPIYRFLFSKLSNIVERIKLDMEEKELESGDGPTVTTQVETDHGQSKLETDNIETEENDPDEGGDKEISENELEEKSDHGSEPDAEVE